MAKTGQPTRAQRSSERCGQRMDCGGIHALTHAPSCPFTGSLQRNALTEWPIERSIRPARWPGAPLAVRPGLEAVPM